MQIVSHAFDAQDINFGILEQFQPKKEGFTFTYIR